VGFLERPERLVLVILGALFNRMAPVLWVIAILSTITVIHRVRYTWTRTALVDRAANSGVAASLFQPRIPKLLNWSRIFWGGLCP